MSWFWLTKDVLHVKFFQCSAEQTGNSFLLTCLQHFVYCCPGWAETVSIGCWPWQALNWEQYLNKDAVVISSSSMSSKLIVSLLAFLPLLWASSSRPTAQMSASCSYLGSWMCYRGEIPCAPNPISAKQHNSQNPLETATKNLPKSCSIKGRERKMANTI